MYYLDSIIGIIILGFMIYYRIGIKPIAAMSVYIIICIFCRYWAGYDIETNHFMSEPHIIMSWLARMSSTSLFLIGLSGKTISESLIRTTFIFQYLSILLGMIWAYDDIQWGGLWQWDPIELLSLCTLFILYGWQKNPRIEILFSRAGICFIILQGIMIYGTGVLFGISRHQYALTNQGMILTIALVIWGIVAIAIEWGKGKSIEKKQNTIIDSIYTGIIYILLLIALMIYGGISFSHTGLYVSFLAIWILYHIGDKIKHAFIPVLSGILVMSSLWWIEGKGDVSFHIASLSGHDEWVLTGIHAEENNDCVIYTGMIESPKGKQDELHIVSCPDGMKPLDNIELWDDMHLKQISGMNYRAKEGIYLIIRDITYGRCIEVMISLLWLLYVLKFLLLTLAPQRGARVVARG